MTAGSFKDKASSVDIEQARCRCLQVPGCHYEQIDLPLSECMNLSFPHFHIRISEDKTGDFHALLSKVDKESADGRSEFAVWEKFPFEPEE